MKRVILTGLLMVAVGCSTLSPDTSPPAISSGDYSLIQTACSPVPAKGFDVCRVHDGDPVTSNWTLYVPWNADSVSGEARIRFGDRTLTYKIVDFSVEIPWKDVIGETWNKSSAGLVQALVTVKSKTSITQALGYAFIVILKPGYDPTPTDSRSDILYKQCSIEYTTAGRSRILCLSP